MTGVRRTLLSPPPFTPLTPPGLQGWYDASDPTTLFQDSALTTPVAADADPVGGWRDKSGRGNHATQATAGKRFAYKVNIQNGLPALLGDGATQMLLANAVAAALTGTSPIVLVSVFKLVAVAAKDLIGIANSADANPFHLFGVNASSQYRLIRKSTAAVQKALNVTTPLPNTTAAHCLMGIYDGTNGSVYLDGTQVGATTDLSGTSALNTFVIGGRSSNGVELAQVNAYHMEVLAYNQALTDEHRGKLYAYLKSKWGLT